MMTKLKYALFVVLFSTCTLSAQNDYQKIEIIINDFIEGTTYNYPEKITSGFLPGASMFLYNSADTLLEMSVEEYAALYDNGRRGQQNRRYSEIKTIEVVNTVGYVKLQVRIPSFGLEFQDLFLFKKIDDDWKVVSKCTTAGPIPQTAEEQTHKPSKEVIMEGLNRPWSMAFISEQEAIIAEKDGDLLLVNLTDKSRKPILGLPTDVARAILIDTSKHEIGIYPWGAHGKKLSFNAGLFQVLLDPNFEENNYLYLSYAAMNKKEESTSKVIRGKLIGNTLSEIQVLLEAEYSHGLFHFGGAMVFGPDGKLYIAIGERNFFEYHNPDLPYAQDVRDKRGNIYRLNPDGSIPSDNPNFGPKAVKGLYAIGIRATQGLIVNPLDNKIWFTDHGTIQGDELNILQAGANYGWPNKTSGKYRSKDYKPKLLPGTIFTDPIYYWSHTIAPTGLTFYNGNEFPQWKGNLIVPGLSKGNLWRLVIKEDQVVSAEELFINDRIRLRRAVTSPIGALYLLSDEENGKLIRVRNGL